MMCGGIADGPSSVDADKSNFCFLQKKKGEWTSLVPSQILEYLQISRFQKSVPKNDGTESIQDISCGKTKDKKLAKLCLIPVGLT